MKMQLELDHQSCVAYKGQHEGVSYELKQHSFTDGGFSSFQCMWNTYVILTEEQYAELKHRLKDAPWNGGYTYYIKHTNEHIDMPEDSSLRKKWDKPYYKIGDDFAHLWDLERQDCFDLRYMTLHIHEVIEFLLGKEAKSA